MDNKRIGAAVRIKLSIMKNYQPVLKMAQLSKDLRRLTDGMTPDEYNEYQRRVA